MFTYSSRLAIYRYDETCVRDRSNNISSDISAFK